MLEVFIRTTGGKCGAGISICLKVTHLCCSRLFFQLTPVEANLVEKRSVELHVTLLNKGTGMANTIAMSRNYENTHRSVATTYWDVVDDEWTVNDMLNLIIHDKKRSRFLFDVASGSGCACWCIAVLGDIEDAGKFSSGVKKAAVEFVNEAARERGLPVPPPRGIFYD